MIQKLSYRKRFLYLLIIFLLFFLIVYKSTLKRTIDVFNQYRNTEKQLMELGSAPSEIHEMEIKLKKLDISLEHLYNSQQSIQEVMLNQIVSYCNQNGLLIKEFPKALIVENEGYTLATNHLIIEGPFQRLIVLLYNIEQKYRLGKVSSARFYKIINNKSKVPELFMELYIQNIEADEN